MNGQRGFLGFGAGGERGYSLGNVAEASEDTSWREQMASSAGGSDGENPGQNGANIIDFEKARERLMNQKTGEKVLEATNTPEVASTAGAVNAPETMPVNATMVQGEMNNMTAGSALPKIEMPANAMMVQNEMNNAGAGAVLPKVEMPANATMIQGEMNNAGRGEVAGDPVRAREEAMAQLAREAAKEQDEVRDILKGEPAQVRYDALTRTMGKLSQEIASIKKNYNPSQADRRQYSEAMAELNELQRKRDVLMNYMKRNQISIKTEIDAGGPAEGKSEQAEQKLEQEAQKPEQNEVSEAERTETAADFPENGPDMETQAKVDLAAAQRIAELLQDPSIVERYEELVAGKSEAQANLATIDTELSGEMARENLVNNVHEKLEQRPGIFARLKKKIGETIVRVVAVLGIVMELSTASVVPVSAEATPTASASYEDEVQRRTHGEMPAGAENEDFGGLNSGEFGDIGETRESTANGSRSDYSASFANFEEKGDPENFGVDMTEYYGDTDGSLAALLEIGRNQPESQASYFACFGQTEAGRELWKRCGVGFESTGDIFQDAQKIDDLISNSENGGEIQAKIDQAMEELLSNKKTRQSAEFYEEFRAERTAYMYTFKMQDVDGKLTPQSVRLGSSVVQRTGQKQLKLDVYDAQDRYLGTLDLNMDCGFQTNVELPQETESVSTPQEAQPAPAEQPEIVDVVEPNQMLEGEMETTTDTFDPIDLNIKLDIDPKKPDPEPEPEPETPPEEIVKPKDPQDIIDNAVGDDDAGSNEQTTVDESGITNDGQAGATSDEVDNMVGSDQEIADQETADTNEDTTPTTPSERDELADDFDENIGL